MTRSAKEEADRKLAAFMAKTREQQRAELVAALRADGLDDETIKRELAVVRAIVGI